ncbi:MAG: helix-turn-helix transcriptional regulator [Clostridia bacterium]|nr:helix-turn-helix transcriptional regulator [Clostridia bacterium]
MNRIKELRLNLGYTQKVLAEFLGCNQSAVGKYEREELEPNIDILKKLANIFKCSIDYLLGREDDFGIIKSDVNEYTSAEKRIITIYRSLTEREKTLFDNLVNSFEDSSQTNKKKQS